MTPRRYRELKHSIETAIDAGNSAAANDAFWVAASELSDDQVCAMMILIALDH